MTRKRDSMELFNTHKTHSTSYPYQSNHNNSNNNNHNSINSTNNDHGYNTLQKESSIISQSMQTVNDVLG